MSWRLLVAIVLVGSTGVVSVMARQPVAAAAFEFSIPYAIAAWKGVEAAPLDPEALRSAFASRLISEDRLEIEPDGKVRARRLVRLDRLVLEDRLVDKPDKAMIAAALLGHVRREGLSALPIGEGTGSLLERTRFLHARDATWPATDRGGGVSRSTSTACGAARFGRSRRSETAARDRAVSERSRRRGAFRSRGTWR